LRPLFAGKRQLMLDHGRGYDVDRLLQVFRANAGLSTEGAVVRWRPRERPVTTSGPGGEQGLNGTAALPLNQWSHLAVTLSGSTGTLYVNGAAVARDASMTLDPSVLGTSARNWRGRSNFSGDPVYAGAFDEVKVWSRALAAAELTSLQSHEARKCSARLGDLASCSFAADGGGPFGDASARGLTATLRRTWGGPSHPRRQRPVRQPVQRQP
jgi:uncharacterized protein